METRRDDGSSSDSSSGGSSSSSDTVLISKPLHQNHRKKLQAQLQQQLQQQEGGRAVAADAPSNVQPQGANESAKVDDICLVCEREGDLYLCTGPCVSAFHLRCLGINREPPAKETWMCPSCTSNVHVCFHCKRLGVSSSPEGSPAPTSGTPAASSVAHTEELRPVRKCRALSCGKFYHPECITNLPLARIAGSNKHFICPLHTCAACEQSGAKKESVRCMRCPVAYHTSCLPKSCAQNFPGKRIICPKHDASDRTVSPVVVVAAADAAADDKNAVSTKLSSQMLSMSDAEKQCSRDRRTDNDEDIKSEASLTTGGATSSNSKKLSKNSKREKKKKKKKRKKMKKHESKERSHDDDDDDADKDFPKGKKKASTRTDSDDDEDEDDGDPLSDTGAAIKREAASSDSITIPAIPASYSEAISPATSTFFESPGKIKARLDEALGQSDDELDSVESPVPQPKHEEGETAPEGAPVSSKHSVTQPTAVKPPSEDEGLSNVKREPQALTSITLADPAIVEQSRSLLSTIQPRPVLASTSRAEPDESGHSASDSFSASQSSGEKKKPKSERKIRRESLLSSSTDGKDLVRQSLFKDKDKSERRSSKKHELGDLSHQISGSPMSSGLKAPRGVEVEDSSLKISVSEGEDGDDEGPGGSSTPSSRRRASVGTPRGGAVDMASLARANKKKKKKKTKNEGDVSTDAKRDEKRSKKRGPDGEGEKTEVNAEEAKWVQCDSCKKWRTVPKDIDLNSMPERWYCKMNTWDSVYASCAVAEEVVDAASKKQKSGSHVKRSSGKIKVKQQPENSIPAASVLSDGEGSSHSSGSGSSSKKTAVEGVDTSTADEKGSKLSKKQESKAKKRKLKLKLKEKYREVKWVQCENAQCGKWRVVPSSIDFNLLPAVWYCHLNTWAPEIANCSAPNPPEVDTFLLKSQSKKGSSSARPTKKLKPTGESSSSATGPSSEISPAAQQLVAAITSDAPPKPVKSGKPPKGTSQIANQSGSSTSDNAPPATPRGANSGGSTPGGQFNAGGAPGASQPAQSSFQSPSGFPTSVPIGGGKGRKVKPDGVKKAVLEWAQCEKCNKWRKLPQHIKSSTLPDKWYCSMNHWDPTRASCSIPEEVDQEPLGASPLPSSQNWYPMPGQVGGGNNGGGVGFFRSKRGKLSYSELLYASTGQLRKTYTSESSTLTFEHEGRTYHRDDQYRSSSMYVSPDSIVSKMKGNTGLLEVSKSADSGAQETSLSVEADGSESKIDAPMKNQPSVEHISACLLEAMDLRHNSSITELVRAINRDGKFKIGGSSVTLSLITTALNQLIHRGLIESVENDQFVEVTADDDTSIHPGVKRRKMSGVSHSPLQYRKVPKRPLKASKCWKFGQSPFEFPLKE